MTSTAEKEKQLACLSLLYEAINETYRAGADVTYSSGVIDHEESLSSTELFLCKLAQICDSQKGGDTITALACLKGLDGPDYIVCSNARTNSELNECVKFLTKLLNYVSQNPDALQVKALRKQLLWRILKFNIARVRLYLKTLFAAVGNCIDDCYKLGEGHHSPALQHLLAINERCNFDIDTKSTENSESFSLSRCEILINIIQDAKAKGLARILDSQANIPGDINWSQLRHLLGRLHSYRQAADTILAASGRRPELFRDFTVQCVSSAIPARSLVPRGAQLPQLRCIAFGDEDAATCAGDIAQLEHAGLHEVVAALQHRHRTKTTVHCEVLLHGYLHDQGKTSPRQFLDDACFIATSKPPCKLCHVYFDVLCDNFRVRAPHLNMYPRWRLPDMDAKDYRDEVLEDMVEQLQDDTVSLLRDKQAMWRRNDSRTDTHAGFQSELGMMSPRGGGVNVRPDSAMSLHSQTLADMPPPRRCPQLKPTASSAGSWAIIR